MKYRIPLQEEVRVWQNVVIEIETDDTPEIIHQKMLDGDFTFHYEWTNIISEEMMLETCENIQYSYEFTKLEDIEEV